jgi:RNA recognition motif-containing protein
MDASGLEDMFTLIGNVRLARIVYQEGSTNSIGRGLVEMSTRQEAEDCALHFNGQTMSGNTLMVRLNEPVERRLVAVKSRQSAGKALKRKS